MKKSKNQIKKQLIKFILLIIFNSLISCSGGQQTEEIIDNSDQGRNNNNNRIDDQKDQKKDKVKKYKNFINGRPEFQKDKKFERLYNDDFKKLDNKYLTQIQAYISKRKENENILRKYKKSNKAIYTLHKLKKLSNKEIDDLKSIDKNIDQLHTKYKLDNIKKDSRYFKKNDIDIVKKIKKETITKQKNILKKIDKRDKLLKTIYNSKKPIYTAEQNKNTNEYTSKQINNENIFEYENKRINKGDKLDNILTKRIKDLESIISSNKNIQAIYNNKYLANPLEETFYDDIKDNDNIILELLKTIGTNTKDRLKAINDKKSHLNLIIERGKLFKQITTNKEYKLDRNEKNNENKKSKEKKLMQLIKYSSLEEQINLLNIIIDANENNNKPKYEKINDIININKKLEQIDTKYKLDNIKKDSPYFEKNDIDIVKKIKKETITKQKNILKKIEKRNQLMQQIINSENKMCIGNIRENDYITEEINGENILEYENERKDNNDDLEKRLTTRIKDLESIIKTNEVIQKIYNARYLADADNKKFYTDINQIKSDFLPSDIGTTTEERLKAINDKKSYLNLIIERGKLFKQITENKEYKLDRNEKNNENKKSKEKKLMGLIHNQNIKEEIMLLNIIMEANKQNKVHLIKSSFPIRNSGFTIDIIELKKQVGQPFKQKTFDSKLKEKTTYLNLFNIEENGENIFNYGNKNFFNQDFVPTKENYYVNFFTQLFKYMKELYNFNKKYIEAEYKKTAEKSNWIQFNLQYNTFKEIIKSLLKIKIEGKTNNKSFIENLHNSYTSSNGTNNAALKNLIDYLEKNGFKDNT